MMNSKTIALLFAMFSLGGMIAIPGLSTAPAAYAQVEEEEEDDFDPIGLAQSIIDDVFGTDEEEEEEAADNTQTIEQPINQEIDQEVEQEQENDQDNTNTQTQTGVIDQDITQGIQDGDDSAKSSSESGDAEAKKHSTASSSSTSGDAENENQQGATNDARLQQLQVQNVDQDNLAEFAPQNADLAAANVAIPIAVPINVDEDEEEEVPPEEPEEPEDDLIEVCVGAEGNEQTLEVTAAQALVLAATLPPGQFELGACEEEE